MGKQNMREEMESSGLQVEYLPVETLVPYARNARTHSDAQVDEIVQAIDEFGWTNPILIDGNGGIIAGHGRLLAASRLSLEKVPCIRLTHLSDAQRRAYILADNRIPLNSGWDEALLKLELAELDVLGFDLPVMGFSDEELAKLLEDSAAAPAAPKAGIENASSDDDDIPDLPSRVVTRLGDIWSIGAHRLACGNAGERAIVAALMQDNVAALCFTSPPYDGQREYDNSAPVDWSALMRAISLQLPMHKNGQVLINLGLVHRDNEYVLYWQRWLNWMRVQGWRRFGWYVWDRGAGLPGDWNGRFAPSFEFIFHFNRQSKKPNKITPCKYAGVHQHLDEEGFLRNADGSINKWNHAEQPTQSHRIPDSVIRIQSQRGGIGKGIDHPAVFPVALPTHIMLAFSDPDDICYEPFCGAGTSLLAAHKTGRVLRAVEISPAYVDVAIIRFRRVYPDIPITLASNGESFEEVYARRLAEVPDEVMPT